MSAQFFKNNVLIILFITSAIFAQDRINQLDANGNKHGIWKGYYEDTKNLKYEGEFKHGKEIGVFTFYDNTKVKNVVATRDFSANDGSCYTIVFNGKHKVSEGKLVNKVHEGEWKFYHLRSDTIMNLENYKNGKLHGIKKVFYNTGLIAEESNYNSGIKDGPYKKVAENGIVLEESFFKNGQYHGQAIFREAAGGKYTVGEFKNGKSVGIWKFYEKDKLVKEENRSEKKKAKPKTPAGEAKRKVKAQKQ
jgi:antitoxin component YwqK of YwqJK toxin-antitoxin module